MDTRDFQKKKKLRIDIDIEHISYSNMVDQLYHHIISYPHILHIKINIHAKNSLDGALRYE